MEPALLKILEQSPWLGLTLYLWRLAAEERREWRTWFEQQQKEITKVIEANTMILARTAEALGEVAATRLTCPAAGAYDEPGEPYRRRRANGHSEEETP